jgi:DNA processing protein
MDLSTAVAASLLPTSRTAVSAAYKDLRCEICGVAGLELLWSASGRRDPLPATTIKDILDSASRALDVGRQLGIDVIASSDPRYPPLLACTANPPPALWLRGDPAPLAQRIVAIVGSRAASSYALQVAGRLGIELAERGIVVSSGLARGVDSAAHRGCLKGGGPTVAVLGCGLDRVYPVEHETLAVDIAKNGLVLSEFAPGTPPLPEHFPLRNRIISGISLATVVVEASEQSGSLITARWALEQGREVMAVPGSVLSGRNRGSHALLKDGAKVVETADDILQELGWSGWQPAQAGTKRLDTEPLLALMDPGSAYDLDELAAVSGLEGSSLLAALTDLELRELVTTCGGKFIRRA